VYLLDANVFIAAKNLHYGFDFVPAFWEWLDHGHSAGLLCSIDAVGAELAVIADELAAWGAARRPLFLQPDEAMLPSLRALANWAGSGEFTPSAVQTFLSSADYQLVAYAHAHGHVVVTHERPAPDARKRIRIPDACVAMGVIWTDPFTMLRREQARFVLQR